MATKIKKVRQIKTPGNLKWPSWAPVLTGKDMLEGKLSNRPGTKHCLAGHYCVLARLTSSSVTHNKFGVGYKLFEKAISKAGKFLTGGGSDSAVLWNDVLCRDHAPKLNTSPDALRARVWNLAMAILGYTEGNPEARYVQGGGS